MIYFCKNLDSFSDDFYKKMYKILPPQKQKQVLKSSHDVRKKQIIMSFFLLIYGLYREYGIYKCPEIDYMEKGKPYFKDYKNVYFNYSHSQKTVALMLSDRQCGIDIDYIDRFDLKIIDKICNEKEKKVILKSKNPNRELCKIWTKKEAILKCIGCGFISGIKNMLLKKYHCTNYDFKEFFISVCKF